jgi:DNA-binding Lrp family transcriptional regulator
MNIAEQLKTLLPGVEISDEFVAKLSASIETAVAQRVEEETQAITDKSNAYGEYVREQAEQYSAECKTQIDEISKKANAYADYVVDEMTRKVDDYCEYVIEKFVEEQKERLVETIEYTRMANVLNSIREAFEASYFTLSDEPANDSLKAKLEESNYNYNTLFEEHRQLKRQIENYSEYVDAENRKNVFESATASLADTQKERLERLVEKANFPTLEAYKLGVSMMVQEITSSNKSNAIAGPALQEKKSVINESTIPHDERMKAYLERL